MQLVIIFQTIFNWSQGSDTPNTSIRVTLGQHEITEEECSFVKTALVSRALNRISTFLTSMLSRIEHLRLIRLGKQSGGQEGADFENIQKLVSSLIQSFSLLSKRLTSDQSRDRQVTEG